MRIPADAIIADAKLTKYLLVHRTWDDKSGFLQQVGFTTSNWNDLRRAIRDLADSVDAIEDGVDEYGTVYKGRWRIGRTSRCAFGAIDLDGEEDRQPVSLHHFETAQGVKMTSLRLFDRVALKVNIPQHGLRAGDVATLVEFVEHPAGGARGCVLEVFNAVGESIAVVTVPESAVELLRPDEILAVRPLAKAG